MKRSFLFAPVLGALLLAGSSACTRHEKAIETNHRGVPVNIADIIMGDSYTIDTLYKSETSSVISIRNQAYTQNIIYTADEILANSPSLVIDSVQSGIYDIRDLLRSAKVNFGNAQSVENFKRTFPQYPDYSTVVVGDTSAVGQKAVFAYAVSVPDSKVKDRDAMLRWVERCINDTMPYNVNARDFGRTLESGFFGSYPKKESEFQYTTSRSMLVYYQTSAYVTYYDYYWGFLGGAHGMYCQRLVSWSLTDGCAVTADYLFKPDSEDAIREIIYETLAADDDFTTSHHLTSLSQVRSYIQEYLGDDPLPIPDPGLTPQGVAFCYQPYEIACYADGAFQLLVPYERLMPCFAVNPLAANK